LVSREAPGGSARFNTSGLGCCFGKVRLGRLAGSDKGGTGLVHAMVASIGLRRELQGKLLARGDILGKGSVLGLIARERTSQEERSKCTRVVLAHY
jgi:hypothetical protein